MNQKLNEMSLEQIENDYWPTNTFETKLIEKCHQLRKVKIQDLTIENLRMLLGQNIGNKIIIPIAIDKLKKDILSEGDLFEGDLLLNLLNTDKKYWKENRKEYDLIINILNINKKLLEKMETSKEIKESILKAVQNFTNYSKRLPTTGST